MKSLRLAGLILIILGAISVTFSLMLLPIAFMVFVITLSPFWAADITLGVIAGIAVITSGIMLLSQAEKRAKLTG